MTDTLEIVIGAIAAFCKCEKSTITPETKLAQDLQMRSVARIGLAADLEERLGVKITTFDILKPKSVQDIVDMIQKKQNA